MKNSIRFSTQYNTKALDIQRVIQKNWNILKQDPILNPVLPSKPEVVFQKAKDLRSLIAPSRVRKPLNQTKTPTGRWTSLFDQKGGAIKPVVTFTPNWGNVLGGDNVTLTCDVPSTVPEEPRTYHWYKDKRPIPGDQQRHFIFYSSVKRDRGDYQCRTIGGDISDPVFLNVIIKLVILQRPPSVIYEGDPLTLRCHNWRFYIAINTKFYKDDQEIKSSGSDSTFHIPNITMSQSGLYKCTKQIQRKDSPYVMERSNEFFISVKDNDLTVAVIAAAVIGSLVVIVVSAVLIWKCKTRKRFSHQDPHQAIPTAENINKPPENNTDPDLQDVCYTYLDISQLSKGKRIKHKDLTVTYATVNNVTI
ncbi:low affinity immunoglobulin gamma Fc region receptor II-like [Aquarana catesbeiana]|uniref:low affinity immunoglobulin gamma Fc region receptor II-like n=1 Tax=Aquarana catesbeiana TaxID=8400 RepID=UPI003CC9E2C2